MAWIFQDRKQGKAGGWYVGWYQGRRRCSKRVGPRKLAEAFRAKVENEQFQRGQGMQVEKPWDEFVTEYMAQGMRAGVREASRIEAERSLRTFGRIAQPRLVNEIDQRTLDHFATERAKEPGKKPGERVSFETINKELRAVRAALRKAVKWNCLAVVPDMPWCKGDRIEKRLVADEHFLAMLDYLRSKPKLKFPREHELKNCSAWEWWYALILTAWVTGQRIGALMRLRWSDVDLENATALSRAADTKQRADHRMSIVGAVEALATIRGFSVECFPWDYSTTALYNQFHRIQRAAGINLECTREHKHSRRCHCYGFHDFRRAHATANFQEGRERQLQRQMGHASFKTTEGYIAFAKARRAAGYTPYIPQPSLAVANGG